MDPELEGQETEADEIDIADDGDGEEGEETTRQADGKRGERPSKEKRRNRYRETQDELQKERELRAREAELRLQEQAQFNREREQWARQQQMQQTQDPIDGYLEDNFRQRQALDEEFQLKNSQGKLTKEELAQMQRKAQVFEDQRAYLLNQKQQQYQPKPDPQIAALEAYAAANHPDVVNNHQAKAYFQGEIVRKAALLQAQGRHVDGVALFRETLDQTERELKLGKYRNGGGVDPGLTTRLAGHSRGAGSSNGNGGQVVDRVVMTDRYKHMAESAFPELAKKDPKAAHEKWAKTVGKRVLQAGHRLND